MADEHRQYPDDDALLSALIDGELSPGEAARLRARIAADESLAARYEALREADGRVRRAFAPVDAEPIPERVRQLLREDEEIEERAAKVVPLRGLRRFYRPPVALAAGVAFFFLGFGLARILPPLSPGTPTAPGPVFVDTAGALERGSPLYRVLENVPSSETASLEGGLSATPRLTFRRAGGGFCRLVDVAGKDGVSSALACRADGAWQLQLATFADRPPTAGDGYRPAAGERSPAVDRAIDGLIEGAPLGSEAEAELLEDDWPDAATQSP